MCHYVGLLARMLFFCHLETQNKVGGGGGCLWLKRAPASFLTLSPRLMIIALYELLFVRARLPLRCNNIHEMIVGTSECVLLFNIFPRRTFLGVVLVPSPPWLSPLRGCGVTALDNSIFNEKKLVGQGFFTL
jgi:hypothetical protein